MIRAEPSGGKGGVHARERATLAAALAKEEPRRSTSRNTGRVKPGAETDDDELLRAARLTEVRCLVAASDALTNRAYEGALAVRGATVRSVSTLAVAGHVARTEAFDVLLVQLGGFPEGDGRWFGYEVLDTRSVPMVCAVSWTRIDGHLNVELQLDGVLVLCGLPYIRDASDADNIADCVVAMIRKRAVNSLEDALRILCVTKRRGWDPVII